MILYKVRNGIIEVEKVLKETKCGWRQMNNGFYNRNTLGKYVYLDETFLTTDLQEALQWAKDIKTYLTDMIQVANASVDDIATWVENGQYDLDLPKSRIVYGKIGG